jgi:outer membrane protein assembly factor BamA
LDSLLTRRDLASVSLAYARNGYPHAAVSVAGYRLERDSICRAVVIEEGPRVTLTEFRFYGNQATRTGTAARIAGLNIPEVFDSRRVEAAVTRLERSGLFERVYPPFLELGVKGYGQEVLAVRVTEKPYHSIYGALGYQQSDGSDKGWLAGALRLSLANIAGTARAFTLHWQRPRQENSRLEMGYAEPFILGLPVSAELEAGHRVEDSSFVQTTAGAVLSVTMGGNLLLGIGGGLERVVPGQAQTFSRSLKYSSRWQFKADFREGGRGKGPWLYGRLDYGRKRYSQTGAQHTVARVHGDGEWLAKLWRGLHAFCGLHGRAVTSGESPVPRTDQFSMGGAGSLRGYFEDQFVANHLAWGSAELRLTADRTLSFHPFWDAGYFWDGGRGQRGIRHGYGFGFRLAARVGRVEVDYGLGRDDGPWDGKVHLLLSSDF